MMDAMGLFRTTIEVRKWEPPGSPWRVLPDLLVDAGDMSLLGAHSLEGLNLKIDPVRKELVPAGPVITAVAVRRIGEIFAAL